MLAAFEDRGGSLSLSEIAAHADIPLPTAHRLITELLDWGAVERTPEGRYVVGLRLWEVSQNAGRQLRDTARPFLQDLFSLTHETSHIAIRDGRDALYIDRVYGSKRVPRASRVGGRLPLHATAVGKVLLAHDEDWVREAYLASALEAPTRRTHINADRLLDELIVVRAQGYAVTVEEMRDGSCSIAVPVSTAPAKSALGLVMLSTQAGQMTRHLPALRGVAGRIEAAVHIPQAAPAARGSRRPLP